MTSKRKQEERLVAILRELSSQPQNKQCFDCLQRGPTYVNMTIGSFVCTSCSGILRGLNPPHRVKSISMATFSQDEIDFMKARGNDYCRRIWLGLSDSDTRPTDSGYKDENHMKDFLILKYEKKRWYVSPSEVARQQSLLERTQQQRTQSTSSTNGSVGGISTLFDIGNCTFPTSSKVQLQSSTAIPKNSLVDLLASDSGISNAGQSPQSAIVDTSSSNMSDGFADFDSAFNSQSSTQTQPRLSFDNTFNMSKSQTAPVSLSTSLSMSSMPYSPANSSISAVNAAVLHPSSTTAAKTSTPVSVSGNFSSDKYSALAELDELFHSHTNDSSSSGTYGATALPPVSGISGNSMPKSQSVFGGPFGHVSNTSANVPAVPSQSTTYGNPFFPSVTMSSVSSAQTWQAPTIGVPQQSTANPFLAGGIPGAQATQMPGFASAQAFPGQWGAMQQQHQVVRPAMNYMASNTDWTTQQPPSSNSIGSFANMQQPQQQAMLFGQGGTTAAPTWNPFLQ